MEKLMKKMGFGDTWVNLMMQCISKATYSVLINGELHGHITPLRGLRQGDPLSPYLFLLCTEGFHCLLRKAEENGDIRGVSICRSAPKLTHHMQDSIQAALGVPMVKQYEKYLGLPSFIGRKKKDSFDNIKQKVWKKLHWWEGKLLSQAGREILIKAVA